MQRIFQTFEEMKWSVCACIFLCVFVYMKDLKKMHSFLGPLDYNLGMSSAPGLFQHGHQ